MVALCASGLFGLHFSSMPMGTGYIAIAIFLFGTVLDRRTADWRDLAFIGLIACLPWASCFSTGNEITSIMMYAMASFIAAIWILARLASFTEFPGFTTATTAFFLSGLVLVQVICGQLYPYGLALPLSAQTEPVALGSEHRTLRVDVSTRNFIGDLRNLAMAQGLKPGMDLMIFYDAPGLLYCLNVTSPGTSWYFNTSPAALRDLLADMPAERLRHSYLLYRRGSTLPDGSPLSIQASLPPTLDLARDFELAGTVERAVPRETFELWKPRQDQ